jgi:hypothetical protein
MEVTLIIQGALAERLQRLAAAQGVSAEVLAQEALATGLAVVAAPDPHIQGMLPLPTASPERPIQLHSPIIAHGVVPEYRIEVLLAPAGKTDAD